MSHAGGLDIFTSLRALTFVHACIEDRPEAELAFFDGTDNRRVTKSVWQIDGRKYDRFPHHTSLGKTPPDKLT